MAMAVGTRRKWGRIEREAGFAFADGGFALAFEERINDGELPAGGGLAGPDAVAAAEEADVFHTLPASWMPASPEPSAEIHVGEEAVLGVAGAHGDGAGVAVPDFDIDVAHGGVEGSGSGIGGGPRRAELQAAWGPGWAPRPPRPPGRPPEKKTM